MLRMPVRWATIRIAAPRALAARMALFSAASPSASSAELGSSRISSGGSP